jgi:hypothetical protein
MSRLLRALRGASSGGQMAREDLEDFIFRTTGQRSNLSDSLGADPLGDPASDYLQGPSMASILIKNAKAMTLRNQIEEAQLAGADPEVAAKRRAQNDIEMAMGPMIASIKQLDR